MEAICFSEISVLAYKTTWCYNPKDHNLKNHGRGNIKTDINSTDKAFNAESGNELQAPGIISGTDNYRSRDSSVCELLVCTAGVCSFFRAFRQVLETYPASCPIGIKDSFRSGKVVWD
jgi:hypothetical protein